MPKQPTEEWRTVASLDHKYAVSNLGRVKRVSTAKGARVGRIIRTAPRNGYPSIGWPRSLYVHLLVAEAFLPPKPSPIHEVNHINGDRTNNARTNLEWVTSSGNHLNAIERGVDYARRGEASGCAKLTNDAVAIIRSSPLPNYVLAKQFGVAATTVCNIRKRRIWRHL